MSSAQLGQLINLIASITLFEMMVAIGLGVSVARVAADWRLVDKRIWPAIDININKSGTRREEMLMDPEEHCRVSVMRRVLADMNPPDAMDLLTKQLGKTKTNAEFLMNMNLK